MLALLNSNDSSLVIGLRLSPLTYPQLKSLTNKHCQCCHLCRSILKHVQASQSLKKKEKKEVKLINELKNKCVILQAK